MFVRAIVTRAAAPWDQARAAALEARMNAPLPLDVTAYVLKRLEPWKPGAQGRYVAVYARRTDVRDGLVATARLDGRAIPVRFLSVERQRQQLKVFAAAAGGAAILVFLLVVCGASVFTTRAQANLRLEQLEQSTQRRLAAAKRQRAVAAQVEAVEAAGLDELRVGAVLADLDWAAGAVAPGASIEAFYREGPLLAVEVRGDQTPFAVTDRMVQRSEKPVRRGVWLWGVTAAPATEVVMP